MATPLELWLEKKTYLEQQLAITFDANQKFALRKQIEECEQEIVRLSNFQNSTPNQSAIQPQNAISNKQLSAMKLTGQEKEQLQKALIDAFNYSSLKQMLTFKLDTDLDSITTANGFSNIVFDLITTANKEGWTGQLITSAKEDNPDNYLLNNVSTSLFNRLADKPSVSQKNSYFNNLKLPARGGEEGVTEVIHERNLIEVLIDALLNASYKSVSQSTVITTSSQYEEYTDNESFWRDALSQKLYPGKRIKLKDFHIIEWLPFSPGCFFTPTAIQARKDALILWQDKLQEYSPNGKASMISGGIGSIRLAEKIVDENTIYFLGVSSSGISHEGIPIVLKSTCYNQIIELIKTHGGSKATLLGYLKQLPGNIISLNYAQGIPRYCFCTEEILSPKPSENNSLLVTVAIMFLTHPEKYINLSSRNHSWSYCSFVPRASNNLEKEVDWLTQYAKRYSEGSPLILTDFDEQYQLFDCKIEFPISDIVSGKINMKDLHKYNTGFQNYFEAGSITEWYNKLLRNVTLPSEKTNSVNYKLSKLSNLEFVQRIEKKLGRNEVKLLWFELFNSNMDDELPNRTFTDCIIELRLRATKLNILNGLFDSIVKLRPDIEDS